MKSNPSKVGQVFLGVRVDPKLKARLQKISRGNRRSLNAQVEIILERGVQHLSKELQAA